MACACKVNQQIDYLHKKYGDKQPQSKKTNISGSVMAGVENFFIYLLAVPFIPFFGIYAIFTAVSGKRINIDKFVRK